MAPPRVVPSPSCVVVDGGALREDGVFLHRQLRVADEPRVAEGVQGEELGDGTA